MKKHESVEQQLSLLQTHGKNIDWSASPKGLLGLEDEVRKGESILRIISPGEALIRRCSRGLVREVSAVNVHVFHKQPDGQMQKLVEEMQVFNTGYTRRRPYSWISEKIEGNEAPVKAAHRGIVEELFSKKQSEAPALKRLRREKRNRVIAPSTTYPGIRSLKTIHNFSLVLTNKEYEANTVKLPSGEIVQGFKEEQSDLLNGKTTYFVWQPK